MAWLVLAVDGAFSYSCSCFSCQKDADASRSVRYLRVWVRAAHRSKSRKELEGNDPKVDDC